MNIKKATSEDVPHIMEIIKEAQIMLANLSIDQWQDGYPNEAQINRDISLQESFVLLHNDAIIGTCVFSTRGEATYNQIEGKWITHNSAKYGVIHRIAISSSEKRKGYAQVMLNHFEETLKSMKYDSLRIDTHHDNLGMQNMIKKLGYQFCGEITLTSGAKRLAFEKLIKNSSI